MSRDNANALILEVIHWNTHRTILTIDLFAVVGNEICQVVVTWFAGVFDAMRFIASVSIVAHARIVQQSNVCCRWIEMKTCFFKSFFFMFFFIVYVFGCLIFVYFLFLIQPFIIQ